MNAIMSVVLAIKGAVGGLTSIVKMVLSVVYGAQAAAGSVRNYVNVAELLQIFGPAILHGGLTWVAILNLFAANAGTIFAGPWAAVAVGLVTALAQAVRLLQNGSTPPTPAPKA